MTAAITCASCKRPLRVPQDAVGRLVQCPLCLDEFIAEGDPVAEAAARAAERLVRRAASQAKPVAAAAPTEAEANAEDFKEAAGWAEVNAEATLPTIPVRKWAPARALFFSVLVVRDPDRILRGRMDAELTADGLFLRKPHQAPAFAAVGGKARYLGRNRLTVTVEGREVELTVVKPWASVYHMAHDTAGFLDGRRPFPNGRAYQIPGCLYALPAVFMALPFAACPFGLLTDGGLGALLWCLIAAALAAATFMVANQPRLWPRTRLIASGGLDGLGALIYLLAFIDAPSYRVDQAKWKSYRPPGANFSVLLPGEAGVLRSGNVQDHLLLMANPDLGFCIHVAPEPAPDGPFVVDVVNGPSRQAVTAIRNRLQNAYDRPNNLVIQEEWDAYQSGQHYHEIVCQRSLGYNGFGLPLSETLVVRVYMANGKVYAASVRGPKVKADAPDALKFFDSFQITSR